MEFNLETIIAIVTTLTSLGLFAMVKTLIKEVKDAVMVGFFYSQNFTIFTMRINSPLSYLVLINTCLFSSQLNRVFYVQNFNIMMQYN